LLLKAARYSAGIHSFGLQSSSRRKSRTDITGARRPGLRTPPSPYIGLRAKKARAPTARLRKFVFKTKLHNRTMRRIAGISVRAPP
jgi:hypothetical protein